MLEVVRQWWWYIGAPNWFGDGDNTHAWRTITLRYSLGSRMVGMSRLSQFAWRMFEIDACYRGPSNEMTYDDQCTLHPMDAIVAIVCYMGHIK